LKHVVGETPRTCKVRVNISDTMKRRKTPQLQKKKNKKKKGVQRGNGRGETPTPGGPEDANLSEGVPQKGKLRRGEIIQRKLQGWEKEETRGGKRGNLMETETKGL